VTIWVPVSEASIAPVAPEYVVLIGLSVAVMYCLRGQARSLDGETSTRAHSKERVALIGRRQVRPP